ncbi:hypothetical protein GmHk_19G056213 [Glycine max]|nr:hypothetical protein GmHk_19G056213 [Glycine max]
MSFAVRWKDILDHGNFHVVVYNQDLDKPTIVAGWIALRDFYHLTEDHQVSLTHYSKNEFFLTIFKSSNLPKSFPRCISLCTKLPVTDVPNNMYYFLKDKDWTHLHLEDVVECRLVFNHWRKTVKIEAGWKYFCETLSFKANMKFVFEFLDPTINHEFPNYALLQIICLILSLC